jgi:uncharacterized cupin superfamily protein
LSVDVFNLHGDVWDHEEQHGGFRFRDAWIGRRLGAEKIGGSLYEVDPGEKLRPYHLHHANEEWLLVVRGRPTLRTPEGERELAEGEVVCFPRGPEGAHQVINGSAEPVRVFMLSTMVMPEIVEYPDSEKVGARDAEGKRLFLTRAGAPVDYWDGEK